MTTVLLSAERVLPSYFHEVVKEAIGWTSSGRFARVIRLKLEGIGPMVAIGLCRELMAARAEYEVDLVVS